MTLSRYTRSVTFILAAVCAAAVAADPRDPHPPAEIERAVAAFLGAEHGAAPEPPQVTLSPLDPRLRLTRCADPLQVFLAPGARSSGRTSVGVRCAGPESWTVYVSASVRRFGPVVVAARPLERGTTLSRADLTSERRELTALSGGYSGDPERLLGKKLRRRLMPGAVVRPRNLITPPLVERGSQVTVSARSGAVTASATGVALRAAAAGERLAVRNESSRRVVEGRLAADRRVEVDSAP